MDINGERNACLSPKHGHRRRIVLPSSASVCSDAALGEPVPKRNRGRLGCGGAGGEDQGGSGHTEGDEVQELCGSEETGRQGEKRNREM